MGRKNKKKKAQRKQQKAEQKALVKQQKAEERSAKKQLEEQQSEVEQAIIEQVESDEDDSSLWRQLAPYILAAAAMLVFAGCLNAPFVFDDAPVITHNRAMTEWSLPAFKKMLMRNPPRMLTNLSFYFNYHFAGTRPYAPYGSTWSYHFISLLLHGLNAALLFWFLHGCLTAQFYRGKDSPEWGSPEFQHPEVIAFFGALLFAIHPGQAMSVAYIAQRYALMAAAWTLGTLIAYNHYRRRLEQDGPRSGRAQWLLLLSFGLSLGCYVSKENAAVIGLFVIALELCFWQGRKLATACLFSLPFFYGVSTRGVLLDNPVFQFSESAGVGVTLALLCFGSALALFYGPGRIDFLDARKDGELSKEQPSKLGFGLCGAALVGALALVFLSGGKFRQAIHLALLMSLGLFVIRLFFANHKGFLPVSVLVTFAVFNAVLLGSVVATPGSFLNRFFKPAVVYSQEHGHYQYFLTQTRAVLFYLKLIFVPWGYTAEHAYAVTPMIKGSSDVAMRGSELLALLGHSLIGLLAIRCWSRARFLSFAILGYYLSLVITSSIVPILDPVVEQRMYLPVAFMMTALVVVLARVMTMIYGAAEKAGGLSGEVVVTAFKERLAFLSKDDEVALKRSAVLPVQPLVTVLLPVLVLLPILTVKRVEVWSSDERIWQDAIAKRPDCARAYSSLGMVRLNLAQNLSRDSKDSEAMIAWLRAISPLRAAVELGPFHVEGWNNLGKAFLELDEYSPNARKRRGASDFLAMSERALKNGVMVGKVIAEHTKQAPGPAVPLCWNNLGLVYRRWGLRFLPPLSDKARMNQAKAFYKQAIESLEQAIKIDRAYVAGFSNMGSMHMQVATVERDARERQRLAIEAIKYYQAASQTGRSRPSLIYNWTNALVCAGGGEQALRIVEQSTGAKNREPNPVTAAMCYDVADMALERVENLRTYDKNTAFAEVELSSIELLLKAAIHYKHPEIYKVYKRLGKLYIVLGQALKALDNYQFSLDAKADQEDKAEIVKIMRVLRARVAQEQSQ